jgi:predicted regulator of amino acid metabolism with ACT domain
MAFNSQAVLDAAQQALDAIMADICAEVVQEAKQTAPVITGVYRDGLQVVDEGVYAQADHSIFVELKHTTIANAVEVTRDKVAEIVQKHTP